MSKTRNMLDAVEREFSRYKHTLDRNAVRSVRITLRLKGDRVDEAFLMPEFVSKPSQNHSTADDRKPG